MSSSVRAPPRPRRTAMPGYDLVDTALCALPSDWIRTGTGGEPQTFIVFTSGTHARRYARVRCSSTPRYDHVFTRVTAATKVASGTTYEIHRYAHPTAKEDAITKACYDATRDLYRGDSEVYHFGNWLIDGHFEEWTASTTPTYWAVTTTTARRRFRSLRWVVLLRPSTANGYIAQTSTENKDLLMLAGPVSRSPPRKGEFHLASPVSCL